MKISSFLLGYMEILSYICTVIKNTYIMEITITEVKAPIVSSFTMFANPDFNIVKETKTIRFDVSNHTKTRLSTSFQVGQSRMGINWKVDGVKTFEETTNNYFTGGVNVSNYFIKSKKQDFDTYKEYLKDMAKCLLKKYGVEIDTLEIILVNRVF